MFLLLVLMALVLLMLVFDANYVVDIAEIVLKVTFVNISDILTIMTNLMMLLVLLYQCHPILTLSCRCEGHNCVNEPQAKECKSSQLTR